MFDARIRKSLADSGLLDLHDDIALVDVRTHRLVAQLKEDVDPIAYADATDQLIAGMRSSDADAIRAAVNTLADLRTHARETDAVWERICRMIERRRRLIETQRRREIDAAISMSPAAALKNAALMLECVTRHLHEEDVLRAIVGDFRAVLGIDVSGEGTIH